MGEGGGGKAAVHHPIVNSGDFCSVDCRHDVFRPSRPGVNGRERLGPTAYVAKEARTCLRETIYAEQSMKGWRFVVTCMVITYSRVWINRVRLPILLVVS